MRLQAIELVRYGAYTERSVELPVAKHDLHVIVGPNEAGKSTLRCAISDLLFGIPVRTPYGFLHGYDDLCIGALIQSGSTATALRRFKRNKQPLRTPDDVPLPDNFFAPLIGTATRESFERTFGLDHEQLVRGGLAILEAKDDVSRMLFQSASGLADFGKISDALTQEADQLWAPRASDTREYYRALKLFHAAGEHLKRLTVRSKDWRDAQNAFDEGAEAVSKADQKLLELAKKRARLERVRRMASPMAQRQAKRAEREALGSVALLPRTAEGELAQAEADIASAKSLIAQFNELLTRAQMELAAVTVDPTALQHETQIEYLAAECNRTRNHRGDIDKRTGELHVKQEVVERLRRDLGVSAADHSALETRIPPQLLRSRITELAQQFGAVAAKAETAERLLAQKEREIKELTAEESTVSIADPGPRLLAALTEARALGDTQTRTTELEAAVRAAQTQLENALMGVRPWTGSAEQLAALDVVDEDIAIDHQRQLTTVSSRLEDLKTQVKEAERALQGKELEERQWQRARDPVTPEALRHARDERNVIWDRVKAGSTLASAVGSEYEAKVDAADGVADRRYLGAKDVEQLETLRSAIETQRLDVDARHAVIKDAERDRLELVERWTHLMQTRGIEGLRAERYAAWLQARQTVSLAAGRLAEAQQAVRRYAGQLSLAKEELHGALLETGVNTEGLIGSGIAGLLAIAHAQITGAEADKKVRQSLGAKTAAAQRDLKVLQQGRETATKRLQQWQEAWSASVTQIGLAADIGVQGATQALDAYAQLSTTLSEIRDLQVNRIDAMRRDLDGLARVAQDLAAAAGLPAGASTPEQLGGALSARLKEARAAKKEAEQLAKAVAEYKGKKEQATIQRESTLARLRPLLERAAVQTLEELRGSVARSNLARALDEHIALAEQTIGESGDSMALEALEAEVTAENLPALGATLDATLAEEKQQKLERDRLLIEKRELEQRRAEIHGQDDAARAESDRQSAIAQMAAAVERYLRLRVSARMLRWAIDRYREEKQDPLLKRAGQIFAAVTLDSYVGLSVDYDGDRPLLKGKRPNGKHVGVEGLSSGARDQLFFALRIAALEQHLDAGGQPLPFVADDLFINFDDQRTAAAFTVLSDLARRTQVIYLTHHSHLGAIASGRGGSGLNIVELT